MEKLLDMEEVYTVIKKKKELCVRIIQAVFMRERKPRPILSPRIITTFVYEDTLGTSRSD